MALFEFSPEAKADLLGIVEYTYAQFGAAQVDKYVEKLEFCAANLAKGSPETRTIPDIDPGLRFIHCQHHYLFGLVRDESSLKIFAILHERMDLSTKVANRLNDMKQ